MSRGSGSSGDVVSGLLGIIMVGGLLWLYAGMSQPATTVVQPYPTSKAKPVATATTAAAPPQPMDLNDDDRYLYTDDYEQYLQDQADDVADYREEQAAEAEQWQQDRVELGLSDCTCQYNAYNCADFATGNDAQACYQHCLDSAGYDVHWLDEDGDGLACELTPRE